MRVAVLGAGGFVGQALVRHFIKSGHEVQPVVRTPRGLTGEVAIDDVLGADWPAILSGSEVVVNAIARVHMVNDRSRDPLAEHRRVNRDGATRIGEGAVAAGVRRLVYISTIKVNGESTAPGKPFRADSRPMPQDPYGISKLEAELALFQLAKANGIEVTVVRPPLVHGPGVRANLGSLIRAIEKGVPLPLGSICDNCRSLVGIDNLVDLIATASAHPRANGEVFLASDGMDVSTRELVVRIAAAMGRRPWLVPVPPPLIRVAARLLGKEDAARRLLENLQIDIAKNREVLGWSPPVGLDEGLRRCVGHA